MSAGIPEKFKVDFSRYSVDMCAQAFGRLLSQFRASPVLKQFLAAFIKNGPEWAYKQIIAQQEANTLYMATGTNLDAIGRIVGQFRTIYRYDESRWMFSDRAGQGADQVNVWVQGAEIGNRKPAADPDYRRLILAKIVCNFTRFASLPELAYIARFATGETVSWRRVGMMECEIYVRSQISRSNLEFLTHRETNTECDDQYMFPYPATLNLSRVVFMPRNPFFADREGGQQCDAGYVAVSRDLSEGDQL